MREPVDTPPLHFDNCPDCGLLKPAGETCPHCKWRERQNSENDRLTRGLEIVGGGVWCLVGLIFTTSLAYQWRGALFTLHWDLRWAVSFSAINGLMWGVPLAHVVYVWRRNVMEDRTSGDGLWRAYARSQFLGVLVAIGLVVVLELMAFGF